LCSDQFVLIELALFITGFVGKEVAKNLILSEPEHRDIPSQLLRHENLVFDSVGTHMAKSFKTKKGY